MSSFPSQWIWDDIINLEIGCNRLKQILGIEIELADGGRKSGSAKFERNFLILTLFQVGKR